MSEKKAVYDFWNASSCGENLYLPTTDAEGYSEQAAERYRLEPYIATFAAFAEARGLRVLEIGVGLGADHQRFAESGAILTGIDLTHRAVEHTRQRFACTGLSSLLMIGDAEQLSFDDNLFDVVYSWGVLHHSPDTARAIREVHRVLEPGGIARIMVYHKWSLVGLMLWVRYGLLRLRPFMTLDQVYAGYLESPGTKAFTVAEAKELFSDFASVEIQIQLSHGDLLSSSAGQRHGGLTLTIARCLWPRQLLAKLLPGFGLFMLIQARKANV